MNQIRLYMVVLVVVDPVHGEVLVELVVFQVAAEIQTLVMQVAEAPLTLAQINIIV